MLRLYKSKITIFFFLFIVQYIIPFTIVRQTFITVYNILTGYSLIVLLFNYYVQVLLPKIAYCHKMSGSRFYSFPVY
jgi:hypothetical protein